MFVCPPKAENIHDLIRDQEIYDKKKALEEFVQKQKEQKQFDVASSMIRSQTTNATIEKSI